MKTNENKRFVYEFGQFVLDPQERALFSDGTAIHLAAKEFETLRLLVENNGKALTKEEMAQSIWQDTFVEENNLAKYISRLRKIVNSAENNYIETLLKHGYRSSADVRRIIKSPHETIVEKHTLQRLTLKVEEELEEPAQPNIYLPKTRKSFPLRRV